MGRRRRPYLRTHSKLPPARPAPPAAAAPPAKARDWLLLALFWSAVLLPLAWGVAATVRKAALLFQ